MLRLSPRLTSLYNLLPAAGRDLTASIYAGWSGRFKYGGVYRGWAELLRQSQYWTAEQVRSYQTAQLQTLLEFVFRECPFYGHLMSSAGVDPKTSDPWRALKRLPVIDRAVVRANYNAIKTAHAKDGKLVLSTSGTTGASLHVPMTREVMQREYAFRWQYYSVAGARRGDRFGLFQGHLVVPPSRRKPPFQVRNYAENTLMFSLQHMHESSLDSYVDAFNRFAPEFVYGYPSALFVLASFSQKRGVPLRPVKAVFTASETLHEFHQDLIQQVFQAPIYQWYGQVETTANLHECEQHRLHIKEEYGLVELLRADGQEAQPGELASVVATGWGNPAFPLIRYDTGDNMILSAEQGCPCGRAGRIIERIAGRDDDFIVTPEGGLFGRLDFVFKAVDTVMASQIVQEELDQIVIRVVPGPGFSAQDEQIIIDKLQQRIGTSLHLRLEKVSDIPRSANGKFRYVISKVQSDLLRPTPK